MPPTPSFRLDGNSALVTGASRGIGRDLVDALAGAGATVVAGVRTADDAAQFDGLDAVTPVMLDVTDRAAIDRAVDETVRIGGGIDIVIANAGLGDNHDAVDVTESDWDRMMDVNAKGAFFTCQAAGRAMLDRGEGGRLIVMSSQAGVVGIERHAVYAASKGAVNQFVKVLALEWSPHGITVNAIAPTFIRTPGTAERLDSPEFEAEVLERIPVGRVGSGADVAAAAIYLASPAGSLVTGTTIVVDGGWTAR